MSTTKLAIAILARNEERQVPRLVNMLKGTDADRIYLFDDNSSDGTPDEVNNFKLPKWIYKKIPRFHEFGEKKNWIHKYLEKFDWVLHVDADEKFDTFFIQNVKTVLLKSPRTTSFALKRVNLPNGNNFPDYQVRLLKLIPDTEWRGKYHEKPYSKERKKPLIDIALEYKNNVNKEGVFYCIILEKFPIIHLPRRKDLKRPWW